MIKPDFWDDQKLPTVSLQARLLYIGLWNLADDCGCVRVAPRWLYTHLFPYDDDFGPEQVADWVAELVSITRLLTYVHEGEDFAYMPKFLIHQKIQHPSKQHNVFPARTDMDLWQSTGALNGDDPMWARLDDATARGGGATYGAKPMRPRMVGSSRKGVDT